MQKGQKNTQALPGRGCVGARLNSCSLTPSAPLERLSKFCQKNIFPFRPGTAVRQIRRAFPRTEKNSTLADRIGNMLFNGKHRRNVAESVAPRFIQGELRGNVYRSDPLDNRGTRGMLTRFNEHSPANELENA